MDCDPIEAESLFRAALQVDPEYGIAHRELGVLLLKQGGKRLAEAEKHLRRAVERLPNDPWSQMHLGKCLWQRGSSMQAYGTFKQAARIAPGLPAPLWAMADIEHTRGNLDEAIALAQRALDIDPEDPCALSSMGGRVHDRLV